MRVTGTLVIVVCLLAGHGSLSTTGAGAWQAQPTINTINPSATLAGSPPFALTVNGTNFAADSVVRWNGSNRTTTFSSATQLTAQILAADVAAGGSAAVTVFNPASGATSNAVTLTITNPLPSLTALSPSAVPAGTGQLALTVTGTNFVAGAVVRWNGADRPTSFISGTQLTAQIAAADLAGAGFAAITVFNPAPGGGVSTPLSFAVNNLAPALSGLSPAAADAGGGDFTLTVNGTNFVNGSVVRWNGSDRPTVVTGPTQLSALIPASDLANAGPAGVTVFTPGPGGGTSNALTFTVNPPNPVPVLTSLSPGSAAVGGGDFTLTVTG
ncbi:MAG TPA: IPT/TIG domain-containing protein, partial [Blastocatellia bacterium]|nr:IPT/TIG domain-containing protein [Blastocatellia bacterium]